MSKIFSITVVGIGKVFCRRQVERSNKQPNETKWITIEEPIEIIYKNGEMAQVEWFKQGNREWNGKYVIEIEYETSLPPQSKEQEI